MSALKIDIVEKRFPDRGGKAHLALRGLRVDAHAGELVCVIGPSGCGKSTLLNLIGGLDTHYEGAALLNGAPPEDIGFMFQEPRLMPWLNVLDNVLLVSRDGASARAQAMALLQAMGLEEVLNAFPARLSGGMQRRVALARAFINAPALLLMDEPFVSLDAPTAARLREILLQLWQRSGATVLFVTHDLDEALALADRVVFLSAAPGQVVLDLPVMLPRPRQPDDVAVAALRAALLEQYPDLLAGLSHASAPQERLDADG